MLTFSSIDGWISDAPGIADTATDFNGKVSADGMSYSTVAIYGNSIT